jgi:hypothetical protein
MYDQGNDNVQIIAEIKTPTVNTVTVTFSENPVGTVTVVIIGA